jgi:hypothetical protein
MRANKLAQTAQPAFAEEKTAGTRPVYIAQQPNCAPLRPGLRHIALGLVEEDS